MLQRNEVADLLEGVAKKGFKCNRISKEAFRIYTEYATDLDREVSRHLLTLIAMEEGPEFELSEREFWGVISSIRG